LQLAVNVTLVFATALNCWPRPSTARGRRGVQLTTTLAYCRPEALLATASRSCSPSHREPV
jgi:hypothetical protein